MGTGKDIPVLVVSGSTGVGKSTLLAAIHEVLAARDVPHGCIDADALSYAWPMRGAFNRVTMLENVGAVWANFQRAGAACLVFAGVIEYASDLEDLRGVIPGARMTVCQLVASEAIRRARLQTREIGAALEWHLHRTVELQRIIDAEALHDFAVNNDDRAVRDVAIEILEQAHWSPTVA